MITLRSLLLVLVLSLTPTALAADFTPDEKMRYKQTEEGDLHLHVFKPEGHTAEDRRPAIVFFFGGGWRNGSPKQFYPHCDYLASRGMVAIAAEYRIASVHGTTPEACVKDGKSAIRYVRTHADALGIDPNRIAAGGGSAGGHVAAATGTVDGFEEDGEDKAVSPRPNAMVLFNPVFDNGPEGYGYDRVKPYWEAFSPLHNIDKDTPPAIVFLGTEDKLIPVSTAEDWKKRMEAAGVRCDLHLYEGADHGFFNHSRADGKYFYKTVLAADHFLADLGFLKGEPTLQQQASASDDRED